MKATPTTIEKHIIHGIAYLLTVRDARFVDIILVRFGRCPYTRNRSFWGGDSYTP